MNNNTHLIFDFDGTLVDSFSTVIEIFSLLADEFNFRKINHNEIDSLRNLTSRELINYLEIPIYKIPSVLHSARKHMQNAISTLPSFAHLPEILTKLHTLNFSLGILTSNSSDNVIAWLKHNNMRHLFSFIHVESNYFGKKRILKKILKSHNMDKLRTFYIGDETRDIEAAKESDVLAVAVTWGFNSEKILLQCEPHYIAHHPEELLTIFS